MPQVAPGVFWDQVFSANGVHLDIYTVKPGTTTEYHGNDNHGGLPYRMIVLSDVDIERYNEKGEVIDRLQLSAGSVLDREAGFKHKFKNMRDDDFVACKMTWPPGKGPFPGGGQSPGQGGGQGPGQGGGQGPGQGGGQGQGPG